ncbi:hypothetical protein BDR07DRAFT_1399715 [Suillus spraguei]|nr:hypothetical protein BDR07DRAFT_1428770 [Suillus spraguei]KAG2365068.1 hypothetical protein BDR07DRAFT_1399715 [Suillus spraguei]
MMFSEAKVVYGPKKDMQLVIDLNALTDITLFRSGVEQTVLNGRGLLHMEHPNKRRF